MLTLRLAARRAPHSLVQLARRLKCSAWATSGSPSRSLTAEQIAERISASQERSEERRRQALGCPGCRQSSFFPDKLFHHMQACCPDVIADEAAWQRACSNADREAVLPLLQQAQRLQRDAQQAALAQAFRQVDATGTPLQRSPTEFAPDLGLPQARCERLLQAAIRATPLPADPTPVEILYEDEHLIAANKPPHVRTAPIHRYLGHALLNRIIHYLGRPPHVLHRLDMETTGVVLFAKTPDAARHVHAQFRERTVQKSYLAITLGGARPHEPSTEGHHHSLDVLYPPVAGDTLQDESWLVNAPLMRHPDVAEAACVSAGGRPASTHVRRLAAAEECVWPHAQRGIVWRQPPGVAMRGASLFQCQPRTGRTHQIRLHLAACGHPIIGDVFYGVTGPWVERHALHAASLTVEHPATGKPLMVRAPLPADMQALAATCGLEVVMENT